eukprot:s171_g25.t1
MVDEGVRDLVAALVEWQSDKAPAFKRLRVDTVFEGFYKLSSGITGDIHSTFMSLTQSSAFRRPRKRQRKYKDEAPDARSKKFEAERRKYSLLLADIIKSAGRPVVQLVNTLDDPLAAWVHLFAARRSNTLKNRYKSWRPFEIWLELHRGRRFPLSCKDVIDHMQFRVDEGCGKSVSEAFSVSLHLIETLGRVPVDEQISKDPL